MAENTGTLTSDHEQALRAAAPAAGGDGLYPPTVTPSPRPLPIWKFLPRFVANPLRALPEAVYHEPVVLFHNLRGRIAWVSDPALLERILLRDHERFPKTPLEQRVFRHSLGHGILTSQGETWRWQRRTAAPLFRPADIMAFVPDIAAAGARQLAAWSGSAPGSVQAIDAAMTDVTFNVIATTIFSGAALAESARIQRASAAALDRITREIAAAMMRVPTWVWYPGKSAMIRASRELRAIVADMLERRRASGAEGSDLMGRLLAARDPETGGAMSDEQLIDNLLTFVEAGHETTAKALTWALYLLARAPDWQQRIREEVGTVTGGGGAVEARHVEDLVLTRRVVKEAMRLYPPAPVLTRVAAADVVLADIDVAAGTLIVIPVYAVHRHRRVWADPDRFDPDRFTPEREAGYSRTQFMPFGFGPRICIGMGFAMVEAVVLLATLVRGADFAWDGRHLPEPISRVTLRPRGGMPLGVRVL